MVQLLVWLRPSNVYVPAPFISQVELLAVCAVFKGRVNVVLVREGNGETKKQEERTQPM